METPSNLVTVAADSPQVLYLNRADPLFRFVSARVGPLSYRVIARPFSNMVETIVGQMLSVKAADCIIRRLYALCGGSLTPETLNGLDVPALRGIGLSGAKAGYILALAGRVAEEPDFFGLLSHFPDEEVLRRLTAQRGIGTWSAKMFLIFDLDRADVLPYEDGAFLQAYRWLYGTDDTKPAAVRARCAPWSPYSSLAARYMYQALDMGLTRDTETGEQLEIYRASLESERAQK
jgi:DNA-3-methyladenine glycosylase II